ncbi:uncharacterized protein [Miscanthus floridulus]|uniref:uncharacterized protein n=1 Tax=Miscanthus floridulus TaxID=154761 RepID=UPI003458858E
MAKNEAPTIGVKLFVDKEKRKVLFAESDKEFIDVLFSFLTMPLGTIVRLLDKQSQMGCLDEVYKSVEDLSTEYFQTKACKAMLLKPLNAASSHCCRLRINIDDTVPRVVYVCKDTSCSAHSDNGISSIPDTVCKCGKVMESFGQCRKYDGDTETAPAACSEEGVFVKGCLKFIVTDDLQVAPASTSLMMSLFEKFGVRDPAVLEQQVVQFSSEKITCLLKRSLTSKQPLTEHYFDVPVPHDDASLGTLAQDLNPKQEDGDEERLGNLKIRVLQMKNNSALLYAEVDGDFVDCLFGLLSIPLGSVMKSFGQCSAKGCLDNLYKSIDGSAKEFVRQDCQSVLLAPKLPPCFGCCASKVLQVDELAPRELTINACFSCFKIGRFSDCDRCHRYDYSRRYHVCTNKVKSSKLCEANPKIQIGGSEKGDAYVNGKHTKFVVTDDLRVLPLSLASTVKIVSEAKIQTSNLVEKEITVTNSQVMELQRAVLLSRNTLSSVLLPPKKIKKLNHLRY